MDVPQPRMARVFSGVDMVVVVVVMVVVVGWIRWDRWMYCR